MTKKDLYIYPSVFEEESGGYNVYFPDLEGAFTYGNSLEEALFMAKEALGIYLYSLEDRKIHIPEPSKPNKIKTKSSQFVQLIEAYMPPVRDEQEKRHVRRNVTISKWVNDLAKKHKLNCSALLESAIKEKLGYRG
ncbi:type II toxin-antitoxin system HicB family antitoxin [Sebaldella sp. S0638]|uniref:type II toxin-antitoxin system HicB family antitoxin n=1 Tax=Sebaldella sp. S0638 TaxID=2957809 RepID=UPI0020A080FD|nr:type II toxin-antitoxin system HicB family antitoxin [Sebaldella sp. S0638]MCP1224716.1 type II toxin-antitoxin system HicB family antitoxin [Sebaldella sp. S0638]